MSPIIRVGGVCAVAGGLLRIFNAFTTEVLTKGTLAVLYFVTDVLLLAGIVGLWFYQRAALDLIAKTGLAIFVAGILTIRVSAFGVGTYEIGAAISLLGISIYSLNALLRGPTSSLAPVLWIIALAAGIASDVSTAPVILRAVAAVAFGAGFAVSGSDMLRGRRT
jgi:hypothetical protein